MNTQQLTKFTKYIKSYLNSKGYDVYTIYNDKRSTGSRRIKIMGRAHLSDQEENTIVSELESKFRKIPDIRFMFRGHFFIELPEDIDVNKLPIMENKMKLSIKQKQLVKEYAKSLVENKKVLNETNVKELLTKATKHLDMFYSTMADFTDGSKLDNGDNPLTNSRRAFVVWTKIQQNISDIKHNLKKLEQHSK